MTNYYLESTKNWGENETPRPRQFESKLYHPGELQQSSLSGYVNEGFEGTFPPPGWQIVDVSDSISGWASSTTADFPASFQGSLSAYCRYEFGSALSGESWLITPQFTVANGDSLSFQFKLEYYGYAPDSTFILVSTTDSALSSFTTLLDFYAEGLNYPSDSSNWYYKTYPLQAFAGQNIYIAFKNKNDEGDGLFIDDVEIGTRPPAEVAAESIDMDVFYPSGLSSPVATINNNGGSLQSFNVTMTISGGYSSTKTVSLLPLSSTQVTFDPWNASDGTYNFNVQTFLAGDANPSNDTASLSIRVMDTFPNYGWSQRESLPEAAFGSAVASVNSASGSRLFLLSGYTQLSILPDAYEYDLNFNTWSSVSPLLYESTLGASATANNSIFVFGGRTLTAVQGSTQIYDYNNDIWTTGTPMPLAVVTPAFGTYKDSLVYIIGGLNDATGTGTNVVQIYNTYTDTWSMGTSKPGNADFGLRGGIVNNKIVITGGASNNQLTAATYVGVIDTLNPSQIAWSQIADYPAGNATRMGSGVSIDKNSSLVIFSGGTYNNSYLPENKTFAYDLNSNSWKLGPDKPNSRSLFYMAPVIQNDSIYLVAPGGSPVAFNDSDSHDWLNLGYYNFPTGTKDDPAVIEAALYPNPAHGNTNICITVPYPTRFKATITDLLGNIILHVCDKIMETGKHTIPINLTNLSTGMYFCNLNISGKNLVKKLIVK